MICAVILACAQGPAGAPSASISIPAPPSTVGQPFAALVSVRHAAGTQAEIRDWELDYGWEVVASGPAATAPAGAALADGAQWLVTARRFEILALEAGARSLPGPAVTLRGAAGGDLELTAPPAVLDLAAALAPGEDAARPTTGFRPPPAARGAQASWPWIAAAAGALALAAGAVAALVRARRKAGAPAPLDRLAALGELERAPREGEAASALHGELARLVRSALEPRPLAHLPDEEWLDTLAVHERALVEPVLARCARVKFAGLRPTGWATQETLGLARAALETLAARREPPGPPRPPAAPGANGSRAA